MVWCPTIPGVTSLTGALSCSGVSTFDTLPAGLRVLRVGDSGCWDDMWLGVLNVMPVGGGGDG
jgi:hypothetical protein